MDKRRQTLQAVCLSCHGTVLGERPVGALRERPSARPTPRPSTATRILDRRLGGRLRRGAGPQAGARSTRPIERPLGGHLADLRQHHPVRLGHGLRRGLRGVRRRPLRAEQGHRGDCRTGSICGRPSRPRKPPEEARRDVRSPTPASTARGCATLNERADAPGRFVLYWMQQSQRAEVNHALEYARARGQPAGAGRASWPSASRTTTRRPTCGTTPSCSRG